jgi:hypothetical protein
VIIINKQSGQLCNQLFLLAHLYSYSIKSGNHIFYPEFSKNSIGFAPELLENKINFFRLSKITCYTVKRFFHTNSKILRLYENLFSKNIRFKIDQLTEYIYPDLNKEDIIPHPHCFFEGWAFRMHQTFAENKNKIRHHLRFSKTLISYSKHVRAQLGDDPVIGLHIRTGDYEKCMPQWFYSYDQYFDFAKNLFKQTGFKIIVISDDINIEFNEPWAFRHRGSPVEDLAVLSECDFVAGPPSTFNRWAAFSGNKPHYTIYSMPDYPLIENFQLFKMLSDKCWIPSSRDIETVRWFCIV